MASLNLDNTINKYLDIINKSIFEPYLVSKEYAVLIDTDIYDATIKDTINAAFDPSGKTIKTNDAVNQPLRTVAPATVTYQDTDYFKIKQVVGTSKEALITNTLKTSIASTGIHKSHKAEKFKIDEDGLIYYEESENVKIYDLKLYTYFTTTAGSYTQTTTIINHTYFDYFVRFKILKYIKNNHLDNKESELKSKIVAELIRDKNEILGYALSSSGTGSTSEITTSNILIGKMLDFLTFINIKNFDKFEATVNCLYYYYYIALIEYNNVFCNENLKHFAKDNISKITNVNLIDNLNYLCNTGTYSNTYTAVSAKTDGTANTASALSMVLILIFETLIGGNKTTQWDNSLITEKLLGENSNSKVKKLINALLQLCGNNYKTTTPIKSPVYLIKEDDTPLSRSAVLVKVADIDPYTLKLNKSRNPAGSTTAYTLITAEQTLISNLQFGNTINDLVSEITTYKTTAEKSNYELSILKQKTHIDKIKALLDLIKINEPFKNAIREDVLSKIINFTNEDYSKFTKLSDIDNTLTTHIKQILEDIIEHYDKANNLNIIQEKINGVYDNINNINNETTTQNDNITINTTLKEITDANNIFKINVDTYKTKNDELNNITKSNLYNNIFLYITIVVLILICLGIIYINNHKASLKTQYSIMVITFLLLYYIIYTNGTINITETFNASDSTTLKIKSLDFNSLSSKLYTYLHNVASSSKIYKESLKKEKNKYSNYVKSSKSKVNSLELVLNDEFINAIKSKELVKFLILFTTICIVCFIIQTNVEDLTTTSIIFIILFIIILGIYFYNINLMTRTKHETKYWNHRMSMK